jgi:hypothetical protein
MMVPAVMSAGKAPVMSAGKATVVPADIPAGKIPVMPAAEATAAAVMHAEAPPVAAVASGDVRSPRPRSAV